jgi:hypothetical protein
LILTSAPNIDKRTAADVAQELRQLLRIYAPAWNEIDASTGAADGNSAALIGVAARFAEIIIQRLNQVPQKNFLAFLELLGAALLPPKPARVPLTFSLAKGSVVDGLVPAGTQVAAPPEQGEKDPVIYETESELVVTAVSLASVFVRDPEEDTYADVSNNLLPPGSATTPLFNGNQRIEHILYLGHSQLLSSPGISNLSLNVDLHSPAGDPLSLRWEVWDGTQWQDKTPQDPANDTTNSLQQSGTVKLGPVASTPATVVNGISLEWLRCRLVTPVTPATGQLDGMARSTQLPQVQRIATQVHLERTGLPLQSAFVNLFPVDLSKDFLPFGDRPRLADVLWMALDEAFAHGSANITLNIDISNPADSKSQSPLPVQASPDVKLRWEVWNGFNWIEMGTSTPNGPVADVVNGNKFKDTTKALTQDGIVFLVLPAAVVSMDVNGKTSYWIRVRILSGNYGLEGHWDKRTNATPPPDITYDFTPPSFQPPIIQAIKVDYQLDQSGTPERVVTYNDFLYDDVTSLSGSPGKSFRPFKAAQDSRPTVYLGFALPPGRTAFPNSALSIFFDGADLHYGQKAIPLAPDISREAADPSSTITHKFFVTNAEPTPAIFTFTAVGTQWKLPPPNRAPATVVTTPAPITVQPGQYSEVDVQVTVPAGTAFGDSDSGFFQLIASDQIIHTAKFVTFCHEEAPKDRQLRLSWEYWNGQGWTGVVVRDDTNNFTTMGVVEFLAPPDFAARGEFGVYAWWLRVRWEEGDYDTNPRANRVLLNTAMAAQTLTIRYEVLGSSDGSANQTFQTIRAPVLSGQSLEVREPEMPSGDELDAVLEDEGADAISVVRDAAGTPAEIWVRWHEVPDFYASAARSRHYTIDHVKGAARFGDGLSGLIPSVGSGNIRLALYRTGGGARGNRTAGSIVQLKTTLPYIDKVVNYDAASGGAEVESLDSLLSRAPAEIRHRRRAVTSEDYQDLAHLASPDVGRALCVSNRDLVADPLDQMPPILGSVSLIVVPNSTDPSPQPSTELVKRIQDFISSSSPVTATVLVVGPVYLRVDVEAEIGLASLDSAGTVAQKVQDALAAFLHPLTGGFDRLGWEFGREPHRSDLYAVIKKIPEADHIRALAVNEAEDYPGIRSTGRFLVYSGTHTIKFVFEP